MFQNQGRVHSFCLNDFEKRLVGMYDIRLPIGKRRRRSFVTRTDIWKEAAHRLPRNQYQRRPFHWLALIYLSDWLSTVTLFISGMITDSKQVNIVHNEKKVGRSNTAFPYIKLRKLKSATRWFFLRRYRYRLINSWNRGKPVSSSLCA
jgi:hypothetical protein